MSYICIYCRKEWLKDTGEFAPVKKDIMIITQTEIKKRLGILKGNQPVVCSQCLPKHRKAVRERDKRRMYFLIPIVLMIMIAIYYTTSIVQTLMFLCTMTALFILFILITYLPGVEDDDKIKESIQD